MCGMTGHLDRYGEPLEDDDLVSVPPNGNQTRDEIHTDRCAELRKILKDARARREAQR